MKLGIGEVSRFGAKFKARRPISLASDAVAGKASPLTLVDYFSFGYNIWCIRKGIFEVAGLCGSSWKSDVPFPLLWTFSWPQEGKDIDHARDGSKHQHQLKEGTLQRDISIIGACVAPSTGKAGWSLPLTLAVLAG